MKLGKSQSRSRSPLWRKRLIAGASVGALLALSACAGAGDEVADQLTQVTVAAVGDDPAATTTPAGDVSSAEQNAGLRVTVEVASETESMTSSSMAESSTTSSSLISTTTTLVTYTTTTIPTTTTLATTSQTSTTMGMTTSSTTGTGSTGSTADTQPTTTATMPPPAQNSFPDSSVLRLATGQNVTFAEQVAGSKPVLVWFWLPG